MKTNLLIILLAIAGTIGCGKPAPVEEPRAEKEPPWVTALREGSTSNTVAIAEVKAWLEKNLPDFCRISVFLPKKKSKKNFG